MGFLSQSAAVTQDDPGELLTPRERVPGDVAALREYAADPMGIPEQPTGGRSGFLEYSLAENMIAIPGRGPIEAGIETAAARVGEGIDVITGLPETLAQVAGAGAWWEENAPEWREWIREAGIEPVFGSRKLIDEEYSRMTWDALKTKWQDTGFSLRTVGTAIEFTTKEGIGSVPDMVALVAAPAYYLGARTAELTEDRRDATGEESSVVDVAIAGGTAAVVQYLDRLGLRKMGFNLDKAKPLIEKSTAKAGSAFTRVAKGVGAEVSTEAAQEYIEAVGTTVRTDFSDLLERATDPRSAEAALAGAIAAAGMGVAGSLATEIGGRQTSVQAPAPDADAAAAVAGQLTPPTAPVALLPPPQRETPEQAPPAVDTPAQAPITEESTPAEMPTPIIQDGEQDFVAPPITVEEMPEGMTLDGLDMAIRDAQVIQQRARARGEQLRATPVGQFISRALRNPEDGKGAKARAQLPLAKVEALFDNLAEVTSIMSRSSEDARQNRMNKSIQAQLLRGGKGLAREEAQQDAQLKSVRDAMVKQAQHLQEVSDDIKRATRGEVDAPNLASVVGSFAQALETAETLGLPGNTVLQAKTPAEVRTALDALNKRMTTMIQKSDGQGLVERGPDTRRRSGRPSDPNVASVMADAQRNRTSENRSTAPTMRAEDLYTTEYVDEEGRQRRRSPPRNSPEAAERRELMRAEEASARRRTTGDYTDASRRDPYEEDATVRVLTPEQAAEIDAGRELVSEAEGELKSARAELERTRGRRDAARRELQATQRRAPVERRRAEAAYTKAVQAANKARGARQSIKSLEKSPKLKELAKKRAARQAELERQEREARQAAVAAREAAARAVEEKKDAVAALDAEVTEAEARVQDLTDRIENASKMLDAARDDVGAIGAVRSAISGERDRPPSRSIRVMKAQREAREAYKRQQRTRESEFKVREQQVAAAERRLQDAQKNRAEARRRKQIREEEGSEGSDITGRKAKYEQQADRAANASGTVRDRDHGVSKDRIERAKRVLAAYGKVQRKTGKGAPVGLIKARAQITARNRVSTRGLPTLFVFDPTEEMPTRYLKPVNGAYPRRKIVRGDDGRVVRVERATPHKPGDPAPYDSLTDKTYYTADQVEVVRGRAVYTMEKTPGGATRAIRAELPEADRTIQPEEMDAFIEFLGQQPFDWGNAGADEVALAQYLVGVRTSGVGGRSTSRAKGESSAGAETIETDDPPVFIDENWEEDLEPLIDAADDPDNPMDDEEVADLIYNALAGRMPAGPEGQRNARRELVEKINVTEATLKTGLSEMDRFEHIVRSTVPEDGKLTVVPHAQWPFAPEYVAIDDGDQYSDEYGIITMPKKAGQSQTEGLHDMVMDMAQQSITAYRDSLAMYQNQLEKMDESGSSGTSSGGKGKTKQSGSVEGGPEPAGDTGRSRRDVDPRLPGRVVITPPRERGATDLYAGIGPSDRSIAAFLERVEAVGNSGSGGLDPAQKRGAALALRQWFKAQERGWGGFLNMDGTGLGKTRQIVAAAYAISEAEAEAGTNRPVALFLPSKSHNILVGQLRKTFADLKVSVDAKYEDGSPRFEVRGYNSLQNEKGTKEYAGVFADEGHSVKGSGREGKGFDALNTKFRAFYTATPTDRPGQEIYYLKHLTDAKGKDLQAMEQTLARALGLVETKSSKGDTIYRVSDEEADHLIAGYLDQLHRRLGPLAKDGALVSRTYGRSAQNITTKLEGNQFDAGAMKIVNDLLKAGRSPNDTTIGYLLEHAKLPYMIERAKLLTQAPLGERHKVIAVFSRSPGGPVPPEVKGTPYATPAIERFQQAMMEAEIPGAVLAGEGTKYDAGVVAAFNGTEGEDGPFMWLAVTDERAGTGLDLNDPYGDSPRHMMIARTAFTGSNLMQLLGRHDRSNNRTMPVTEFIALDNEADLAYRKNIARKIRVQEEVSGVNRLRLEEPDAVPEQLYEQKEFLARKRNRISYVNDNADGVVGAALKNGPTSDVRALLERVAKASDNPQQAEVAASLAMMDGWEGITVRALAADELPEHLGLYDPATKEVLVRTEQNATQTLLHELIHHATHRNAKRPQTRVELLGLMRVVGEGNTSVTSQFPGAFTSPEEFIAEAFTDPAFQHVLRTTYADNGKRLSMFDRFVRWVASALGFTDTSYNALDRLLDLDLVRLDGGIDFDSMPLARLRAPTMGSRAARVLPEAEKFFKNRAAGGRQKWHTVRKAMIWSMTLNQIVDTYKHLTVRAVDAARPGNILEDILANKEETHAQANRNNKEYQDRIITPLRRFAQGSGQRIVEVRMREGAPKERMTQLEYLAHVMNISGYAGVHFTRSAGDPSNRRLTFAAEARAAWQTHATQFRRMPEARKIYDQLAAYFEKQQNEKRRVIAGAYLDTVYPDEAVPWGNRNWAAIRNKLTELNKASADTLKDLGVRKDALDELRKAIRPGIVPGAYFPLRRYGDYVVIADGDQPYTTDAERDALLRKYPMAKNEEKKGRVVYKTVARFETLGEARRYSERLKEDLADNPYVKVRNTRLKAESAKQTVGNASFSGLMQNFSRNLDKRELDPAQKKALESAFAQSLLDIMPETSVANAMRSRQGIHGASLDITRVLHNYGAAQGYMMANIKHSRTKAKLMQELNRHTRGMEVNSDLVGASPHLAEDAIAMETVRQALMSREATEADNPVDFGAMGQKLADVGFLYYLVGFSYNLVNATQVPLVAGPYLTARYGVPGGVAALHRAYATVGKAPVMKLLKTGGSLFELRKIFSGEDFDRENYEIVHGPGGILEGISDPNHEKLLKEMVDLGDIEASLAMDMGRLKERPHVDEQGRPIRTGVWDYLTDWMRMAPHITEVMNRSVTAIAAFDLEYARSKDYEKAKRVARDAVKQTQFVYQHYNKPPAFQNQFGRLALMFKQHVQHMYYYMIRNAHQSIKGMGPADRMVARRALGYFVLMHVLAAGAVGGTPELVKWILNLGFWALSDDDEPIHYDRWLRNLAYDLFGSKGATFASYGLPGFLGMDLSGRIGIDSMLMFDTPNFDTRKDAAETVLTTAGGPLVGLGFRGIDARNSFHNGQYDRMAENMLPKALRDPVKAYRMSTEGMQDLSGKTYLDADELSWWDYGQMMLGFAPSEVTDTYQSRSVGRDRVAVQSKRNRLFVRFYEAGTKDARAAVIEDIRDWNRRNPAFAITRESLVRSVSTRRRIEAQTEKGVYTPKQQREWAREQQRSY